MQHCTPCRRYLCRAISSAAWGCLAPVPLCAFPLGQLLLPPQPTLQHRPITGAHAARQMWGGRGEQEVLPLWWGECEEGSSWIGSWRVRRGKRRGSRGGCGGDVVGAAGDGRHRARREGRGQVLATAVGHGGQRWQGRGGRGRRAPASHSQGDPLRGDGVDLRGHGSAGGAREGQGGGGQAIAIQLARLTGVWEEGKEPKERWRRKRQKEKKWKMRNFRWVLRWI